MKSIPSGWLFGALCVGLLSACTSADSDGSKDSVFSDTGASSDSGEKLQDTWRAKGSGFAKLVQATQSEMPRLASTPSPPKDATKRKKVGIMGATRHKKDASYDA